MRKILIALSSVTVAVGAVPALAQEHNIADHLRHMAVSKTDNRQIVGFPPAMREHALSNMRDHLQALSEILAAMSAAQYAEAAEIAGERLGLMSPSAAGCKADDGVGGSAQTGVATGDADHQMAGLMPEGMRAMGLAMHGAASDFAEEAAKAGGTGDVRPAMAALSRVTRQCAVCHSSYRFR